MRSKLFRLFALAIVISMVFSPLAPVRAAGDPPGAKDEYQAKSTIGVSDTGLYIVRLADPALAAYSGGVAGIAATSPKVTGERKVDVNSPASQAYVSYLEGKQAQLLTAMNQALGRQVEVAFQYLNVLNGVAVRVSQEEAVELSRLPGVIAVYADTVRTMDTDYTPEFLGATEIWAGETSTGVDTMGEGIIIGVIDSGINSVHPSFAGTGGDGYAHTNPYGDGVYKGVCNPADPNYEPAYNCTAKLIGAYRLNPASPSAEDDDGHGSHTASTSGGNYHEATFDVGSDTFTRWVGGMAPHANLINYQVCAPGCPGTASVAAVNHAIGDGVDVLNYSISGGDDPWNDPVDQAFLDAYEAGIFVSASAGNAGPGASTVAKTGPWNAAVAATTTARLFMNSFDVTAPTPVPGDLIGRAAVVGENNALTSDLEREVDYHPTNLDGCAAFPPNYFSGQIALIQRGSCTFAIKVNNAAAAGAAGVLIFNNVGGPPITMGGLAGITTPAVMTTLGDGLALIDYIDLHDPTPVSVILYSAATAVINPDWGDIMAGFSSRGPSQFEMLKPDYAAPGVNILAASIGANGYELMQGTSMAAPHGAGSAALMIALHPDWTPFQIKSALAMSANPEIFNDNGVDPAPPFAMGTGRLDLSKAALVGLTLDETYDNFVAANPALGGDPKTLNMPGLVSRACLSECTFTRTVKNVTNESNDYTVGFDAPAGTVITVDPANFTIAAGATQELEITINVSAMPLDEYVFAHIYLETDDFYPTPIDLPVSDVHFTVAVMVAETLLPDQVFIYAEANSGSQTVSGLITEQEITDLSYESFGLVKGVVVEELVPVDPTNSNPYNGDGSFTQFLDVPAGALRLVAEIFESEAPDVDLFVGTGSNPSEATTVCTSATAVWNEYCNLDDPAPGPWWILVQNWQGSGAAEDLISLSYAVVPAVDAGNMTIEGPETVPSATYFEVDIVWDEPSMSIGDRWYGAFSLGAEAATPDSLGTINVDLIRVTGPAGIEITPESIAAEMATDSTMATALSITNTGEDVLAWLLAEENIATQNTILDLSEGFDDITLLPAQGWVGINNSSPVGVTTWFQGNTGVFPAYSGADNSYIGANFNSTTGVGTINTWLLTPAMTIRNGDSVSFYTRIPAGTEYPDRLELRLSTNGDSTDVGSTATDVGDFTTLLLSINPDLTTGVYPKEWTEFTATISGLSGEVEGRLGFRYFVTGGGPSGSNSNYIGIDSFEYSQICETLEDIPWLSLGATEGETLSGETDDVDIYLDSTGLANGLYTGNLCVFNNANGLEVVPVELDVVDAVYDFMVEPTESTETGVGGESVEHVLTVTNLGNANDTFDVTITAGEWEATAVADLSLAIGESAELVVTVDIPADAMTDDEDVTVVTITSQGDDTLSVEATLTTIAIAADEAPIAGFEASADVITVGETVVFTNTTTGTEPIDYLWNVGDVYTSTETNIEYTFTEAGTYTVTLTASNALGEDEAFMVITVNEAPPAIPTDVYLPIILKP